MLSFFFVVRALIRLLLCSSDNYDLKSKSTRSGGSGGGGRSRDNSFPDEGDIKVSVVLEGVPDHHFVRGVTEIVPEYGFPIFLSQLRPLVSLFMGKQ